MRSMESRKMHQSLATAGPRRADQKDQSLHLAARCEATMRPPAFFEVLPPELRCIIYDFAYGEEGVITVDLQREAPLHCTALSCAFDPIIGISKEWLNEALGIFMRSKQFQFKSFEALGSFAARLPQIKKNITRVSWRQESIFRWPIDILGVYDLVPNLESLHVFMGRGEYFALSKIPMEMRTQIRPPLNNLRGLREFHASFDVEHALLESAWIQRTLEDGSFHANVEEYLAKVRQQVTKPKGT